MNEDRNSKVNPQKSLKIFFIKLISISIVIIIIINLTFNLIFADRLLLFNKSEFRNEMKEKVRKELNDGLKNEYLISEEDKILLYKLYLKLREEFQNLDKSKF